MTEIPSRRLRDGDGANSKGVEDGGGSTTASRLSLSIYFSGFVKPINSILIKPISSQARKPNIIFVFILFFMVSSIPAKSFRN